MMPSRNYYFACESDAECSQWVLALQQSVGAARPRASSVYSAPDVGDAAAAADETKGEPNCFRVSIVQAKELVAADSSGTSDPFCVLSLKGRPTIKSKVRSSSGRRSSGGLTASARALAGDQEDARPGVAGGVRV